MKTFTKTLTAILFIAITAAAQAVEFVPGVWDGTADTDWYDDTRTEFTIATAEDLAGLAQLVNSGNTLSGKTVTLVANVNLNDTIGWLDWGTTAPVNTWVPIGTKDNPFAGTFDGAGSNVIGIYINTTDDYQGLFGYLGEGGTIKNVGVIASYIKGGTYIGGLVGNNAAGVVGNNYSVSNVSGSNFVGGLVGYNSSGTIRNNYSIGAVSGTDYFVGGLVGGSYGGTVSNSYYDKETSEQSDNEGKGEGKTTAEMQTQEFINTLNLVAGALSMNAWVYEAGEYPKLAGTPAAELYFASGTGTEANPYIIETKEQLQTFSLLVNTGKDFNGEYVKLGNDIALNDTTGWQNWNVAPPANIWESIGECYNSVSFVGTFDGAGYVISGVYVNNIDNSNTGNNEGLFGCLGDDGVIKNVGVVASYIKGIRDNIGGLVGWNSGTVSNSYSSGTVSGVSNVGGLVGVTRGGTISNSYSTGTINGNYYLGGLVGFNYDGTISNSYSTGTVNGTNNVGGLVGENYEGTVSNSYYNKETSGQSDEGKGEGKTIAEMKTQSTYENWDFTNVWRISKDINNGYPYLVAGTATPVVIPQIAGGKIQAQATANAIQLSNLPANSKVEVYNLRGGRIYVSNRENPRILIIGVPTKGMYIVKATHGSERQVMRVTVK